MNVIHGTVTSPRLISTRPDSVLNFLLGIGWTVTILVLSSLTLVTIAGTQTLRFTLKLSNNDKRAFEGLDHTLGSNADMRSFTLSA